MRSSIIFLSSALVFWGNFDLAVAYNHPEDYPRSNSTSASQPVVGKPVEVPPALRIRRVSDRARPGETPVEFIRRIKEMSILRHTQKMLELSRENLATPLTTSS